MNRFSDRAQRYIPLGPRLSALFRISLGANSKQEIVKYKTLILISEFSGLITAGRIRATVL